MNPWTLIKLSKEKVTIAAVAACMWADQTDAANITTCCVTAAVASLHLVMPLAPGAAWHPRGQCDAKAASISAMGSYQLQRSHHLSRLPHLERMFWIRMYLYFQHPIIVGMIPRLISCFWMLAVHYNISWCCDQIGEEEMVQGTDEIRYQSRWFLFSALDMWTLEILQLCCFLVMKFGRSEMRNIIWIARHYE